MPGPANVNKRQQPRRKQKYRHHNQAAFVQKKMIKGEINRIFSVILILA